MNNLTRYNKFKKIKKEAYIWSYVENDDILYNDFIILNSDNYSQEVESFINIQKYIYEAKEYINRHEENVTISYVNSNNTLREELFKKREKYQSHKIYIDVEVIDVKDMKKFFKEIKNEIIENHFISVSFLVKEKNYKKYFFEFEEIICCILNHNVYKNYREFIREYLDFDELIYTRKGKLKVLETLKNSRSYFVKILT
jgi:hypothetical protein